MELCLRMKCDRMVSQHCSKRVWPRNVERECKSNDGNRRSWGLTLRPKMKTGKIQQVTHWKQLRSQEWFDRLNCCEASATRRRLRPLGDPGRASWRYRLLERKKDTCIHGGSTHQNCHRCTVRRTSQDLARVEKSVSDGYWWNRLNYQSRATSS